MSTERQGKIEEMVEDEIGLALDAARQGKVLKERNDRRSVAGCPTTMKKMGVLSMMCTAFVNVDPDDDHDRHDNDDDFVLDDD